MRRGWIVAGTLLLHAGCGSGPTPVPARHLVLVTIDTLRADHVGAYGAAAGRTPTLDRLAGEGVRFDRAWAPAPITLPSHATMLTGLYPPGHGSRHNGVAVTSTVPTLAERLAAAGFETAAFVSAFPLDARFGLARGFSVYDDELPRDGDGRPRNERAGAATVDRAIAWLRGRGAARTFLWLHLFEPHAPYEGHATDSADARYAAEVTAADHEAGRLLAALGDRAEDTLVVATADHGEAFGEHGEQGHSIFVYDTTLRVPLILRGPGIPAGTRVDGDVSLVDLSATVLALLDIDAPDRSDGVSLVPAIRGAALPPRPLYAESFAAYFDFGWAGLRAVREPGWKYIAAPTPELFDLARDAAEASNLAAGRPEESTRLGSIVEKWSGPAPQAVSPPPDVAARLGSLGYVSLPPATTPADARPDPKDRRQVAAWMAQVTSGELTGDARIEALRSILAADPGNPQAHVRLGVAEAERGRCAEATPHFRAAIGAGLRSADAGLGLAACLGQSGDLPGAEAALIAALAAEPRNPVVTANLGLLALERGQTDRAVAGLREAVSLDPDLLPARFALARALARAGDRLGALAEARTLLDRLPADAPQRAEVLRLVNALQ